MRAHIRRLQQVQTTMFRREPRSLVESYVLREHAVDLSWLTILSSPLAARRGQLNMYVASKAVINNPQ